eukprot:gene17337-19068_t
MLQRYKHICALAIESYSLPYRNASSYLFVAKPMLEASDTQRPAGNTRSNSTFSANQMRGCKDFRHFGSELEATEQGTGCNEEIERISF